MLFNLITDEQRTFSINKSQNIFPGQSSGPWSSCGASFSLVRFRWCVSHPRLNSRKTTMSQYCPGVLYRMLLNFCPCTKVRGVQNELVRGFGDPLEAFIQKFRAQQLGSRYFTKSNKCGSSGQRRVAWNFQRPHLGTQLSMPLLLQAFARGTALRCLCLFTWSHYLKSICSTRSWCILSKLWLGIIFSNFQAFCSWDPSKWEVK